MSCTYKILQRQGVAERFTIVKDSRGTCHKTKKLSLFSLGNLRPQPSLTWSGWRMFQLNVLRPLRPWVRALATEVLLLPQSPLNRHVTMLCTKLSSCPFQSCQLEPWIDSECVSTLPLLVSRSFQLQTQRSDRTKLVRLLDAALATSFEHLDGSSQFSLSFELDDAKNSHVCYCWKQ